MNAYVGATDSGGLSSISGNVLKGPNEKYRKSADFSRRKPTDVIVFLDERPMINDGFFWSPASANLHPGFAGDFPRQQQFLLRLCRRPRRVAQMARPEIHCIENTDDSRPAAARTFAGCSNI